MSTDLGMAKVYFTASDFGKMLKLKDEENLIVKGVKVSELGNEVEVTIITPMDNSSNNRVKGTSCNDRYNGIGLIREDNNFDLLEENLKKLTHQEISELKRTVDKVGFNEKYESYTKKCSDGTFEKGIKLKTK